MKGEVLRPNDAPVEFFVPGENRTTEPNNAGSKTGQNGAGSNQAGSSKGKTGSKGKSGKPSLLDLLPPSPKAMPQLDGPGDSDGEEEEKIE